MGKQIVLWISLWFFFFFCFFLIPALDTQCLLVATTTQLAFLFALCKVWHSHGPPSLGSHAFWRQLIRTPTHSLTHSLTHSHTHSRTRAWHDSDVDMYPRLHTCIHIHKHKHGHWRMCGDSTSFSYLNELPYHASIRREFRGSVILFYRSPDWMAIEMHSSSWKTS